MPAAPPAAGRRSCRREEGGRHSGTQGGRGGENGREGCQVQPLPPCSLLTWGMKRKDAKL